MDSKRFFRLMLSKLKRWQPESREWLAGCGRGVKCVAVVLRWERDTFKCGLADCQIDPEQMKQYDRSQMLQLLGVCRKTSYM